MEAKLCLLLMFYRNNITHEFLGFLFDLDVSNVTRLIGKLSKIFGQAAALKLKTRLQEAKQYSQKVSCEFDFFYRYPELSEVYGDAAEQRKQRARDAKQRKLCYSGKKKALDGSFC